MKDHEYEKMHRAEKRFWWFVGKGLLVKDWAERWFSGGGYNLDVGCGTGANLERLAGAGSWTGIDASGEAISFCVSRGHRRLLLGDAGRLPFADESFDHAVALDLFEHLEDDEAAAAEIFRVLRPGGRVLVTVPAHPFLWGSHDRAMGHFRRYSRGTLSALLMGSGFTVARMTHFMGLLFPAMFLVRLVQKRSGGSEDTISYEWPEYINRALLLVVGMEVRWLSRFGMPAGTTLAAVVERPVPH